VKMATLSVLCIRQLQHVPRKHTKTVVIRGPTTNFRLTTKWVLASPPAQSQ
jgi:hypothetical protein